jgi:ammonia channel protein AmtB
MLPRVLNCYLYYYYLHYLPIILGGALVIGSVATAICYSTGVAMKTISGIDDTLDVFAVHGVGGTIGVLLTGVFCSLKVNDAGHDGLGIDINSNYSILCFTDSVN